MWQITIGRLPLRVNPQRLSVIFSSFFKKHECLLWKRPAGKYRYEVLPTDMASILSWFRHTSVILIESVFPAVQSDTPIVTRGLQQSEPSRSTLDPSPSRKTTRRTPLERQ
jgi:hypothetical protein